MSEASHSKTKSRIVRAALVALMTGAVFVAAADSHAQRGFSMGRGVGDR